MSNLSTTIEQIKSEFRVSPDGRTSVSIRGAARLADVDDESIRKALSSADQKPSKLAEFLLLNGFEGADQKSWSEHGIPDTAFALMLEYYAHECQPRYRSEQAKLCCRAFCAIGIRAWIQQEVGWQPLNATITEAQVIQLIEERLLALAPVLTEQIVEQSASTIVPMVVSKVVEAIATTFAYLLAPIQEQVNSIYSDLEAKKKKQRPWTLPEGTPKEEVPSDYIKVAGPSGWVSPDCFAYMQRQSQWDKRRADSSRSDRYR